MSDNIRVLGPLATPFPGDSLFAAWLNETPIPAASSAATELSSALSAPDPAALAPLWQNAAFARLLPPEFRDLPHGPGVVVTGQQPGFLGGPLLTLYKIATAISLARMRSQAGSPTVPVFWSGDDDDDLAEALAPVGWDAEQQELLHSDDRELLKNPLTQRAILAEIGPEHWAAPTLNHLVAAAAGCSLAADLIRLLKRAVSENQNWGQGQVNLIGRIFAGSGLVIIRGHDSRLHELAAPFYSRLSGRLDELATVASARGAELEAAGFQVQISDRSLSRPLFRIVEGRRETTRDFLPDETGGLRPGVMLRSPLQDWLLQPAAVVVGPGELAYLRQLDPLYAALKVPRCALIPRMCGWVIPDAEKSAALATLLRAAGSSVAADTSLADGWADQIVDPARERMAQLLAGELGLATDRAATMADKRARRFRKGVVAMFRDEVARLEQQKYADVPAWVLPEGQRQERALGLLSALGLWGEDLINDILAAAGEHLEHGRQGSWQEMAITAPEGTANK